MNGPDEYPCIAVKTRSAVFRESLLDCRESNFQLFGENELLIAGDAKAVFFPSMFDDDLPGVPHQVLGREFFAREACRKPLVLGRMLR